MDPSRGKMFELARYNSTLAQVISLWQHETGISWEQAMMIAVEMLVQQNESLMKEAVNHSLLNPEPFVVDKRAEHGR